MVVDTPRVLVVSESRITRRVVEMTFADQPIELVMAASGQLGLEAWADRPAAVVVADLGMEAPDGLAVARQVAIGPQPPAVILLAGPHETIDEDAIAAAGVRYLLRKPLDSLQLIEAVRSAIRDPQPPAAPVEAGAVPPVPAVATAPWAPASVAEPVADDRRPPPEPPRSDAAADLLAAFPPPEGRRPAPAAVPLSGGLNDRELERVAERVMAMWQSDVARDERVAELVTARAEQLASSSAAAVVERLAPAAAAEAAERLVRELAPALVSEVARMVVADVSERLVREEIARMRAQVSR
jgi:CheY-like chemotaxis protein